MSNRISPISAHASRQTVRLMARMTSQIFPAVPSILTSRTFSSSTQVRSSMEPVFTPHSVKPIGPYSQAIKANGFIFVSGQIPAETNGQLIQGTTAEKTHKMCQNARAVLEAAGSGLDKVVKVTVYFRDFNDFKEMNEVYATYFPHKPARSSCEATKLPAGASMEMDIIALA